MAEAKEIIEQIINKHLVLAMDDFGMVDEDTEYLYLSPDAFREIMFDLVYDVEKAIHEQILNK